MELATRRLIDAAATLPAVDRALLSLWTQRGLDDVALARMTGVDPSTIEKRREGIVDRLSAELGLPPEDVSGALTAMAGSSAEAMAGSSAEAMAGSSAEATAGSSAQLIAVEPAPLNGGPHAGPPPHISERRPEPEVDGTGADRPRRRRPLLWAAGLLAAAAVVIVVLVASGGGSSAKSGSPVATRTAIPTSAATPAATPVGGPRTLAPLPGGDAGASGTVGVTRSSSGLTLHIRVTGLPVAGTDHYEVWLYNSIIDSTPLGSLPPGGGADFPLPASASRYASIDVSRQPAGTTQPSGASVLRAPDPAAG